LDIFKQQKNRHTQQKIFDSSRHSMKTKQNRMMQLVSDDLMKITARKRHLKSFAGWSHWHAILKVWVIAVQPLYY